MITHPELVPLDQPIRVYRTQNVTRVRRLLNAMGLLPLAFRVWRAIRFWRPSRIVADHRLRAAAPPDAPIPPSSLLLVTAATPDVEWFLKTGEATASAFRDALSSIGRPIESFAAVLDFGCGCGRVLRQWRGVAGPAFFGTDYNPRLVQWCQRSVHNACVSKNELTPPLTYDAGTFDLVYAVSVFTHLPEAMQNVWLVEIQRIMRPGGILLATLSGEGDLIRTTPAEQDRFRKGELVVIDGGYAGTNMCGAYHPQSYVRRAWSQYFKVLSFIPEGAKGSPHQDLYVLERQN
jgi:SAM-dependent methyltransferase